MLLDNISVRTYRHLQLFEDKNIVYASAPERVIFQSYKSAKFYSPQLLNKGFKKSLNIIYELLVFLLCKLIDMESENHITIQEGSLNEPRYF
jgi:hypothetical protein